MSSETRLPLNTLAIAFGLTGLAEVWSLAETDLGTPVALTEILWLAAAIAWVWLVVAHTRRGHQSGQRLIDQLRHPVQGPLAALVPLVAMLLGAHIYRQLPWIGFWIVVVSLVAALIFAGWLIGRWITGGIEPDAIHGGYFLPTVAAGFIGATTAMKVGLPNVAIGAFAIGAFFWLVIFTMLIGRLALRPPLPGPLLPTVAILVAPPAVGGTAWMAIADNQLGAVDLAFAALTILMVLVQIAFVRSYLALRFTLGFWSFTFPFAAVIGYGIEWLALERPEGWQIAAWVMLLAITLFILAVAAQSLRLTLNAPPTLPRNLTSGEKVLATADDKALIPKSL